MIKWNLRWWWKFRSFFRTIYAKMPLSQSTVYYLNVSITCPHPAHCHTALSELQASLSDHGLTTLNLTVKYLTYHLHIKEIPFNILSSYATEIGGGRRRVELATPMLRRFVLHLCFQDYFRDSHRAVSSWGFSMLCPWLPKLHFVPFLPIHFSYRMPGPGRIKVSDERVIRGHPSNIQGGEDIDLQK